MKKALALILVTIMTCMVFDLPIFVCKKDGIASVAIGSEDSYAVIIYQSNPLSTSYGFLYGNDPLTVKATFEMTNDSVWEVDLNDYSDKLALVVEEIGNLSSLPSARRREGISSP